MDSFRKLFARKSAIIGMIHLNPLPGAPLFRGSMEHLVCNACKEFEVYLSCGVDGILVENTNDVPYLPANHLGHETTAAMTSICNHLKLINDKIPIGCQVLAAGNKQSLAIAKACGLHFVRTEGFVFSHIADEGLINGDAGELLRYRTQIDARDVLIFADIKKKHCSHAITSDVSISDTAAAAENFCADGVIITGSSTGVAPLLNELQEVRSATTLPLLVGSGVTIDNISSYIMADAIIIGSHFKLNGNWRNSLDVNKIKLFMEKYLTLIKSSQPN